MDKDLEKLVRTLRKHNVSDFNDGSLKIKFHYEPKQEEVPKVYDADAVPKTGHRLRPPSDADIAKERLTVW